MWREFTELSLNARWAIRLFFFSTLNWCPFVPEEYSIPPLFCVFTSQEIQPEPGRPALVLREMRVFRVVRLPDPLRLPDAGPRKLPHQELQLRQSLLVSRVRTLCSVTATHRAGLAAGRHCVPSLGRSGEDAGDLSMWVPAGLLQCLTGEHVWPLRHLFMCGSTHLARMLL